MRTTVECTLLTPSCMSRVWQSWLVWSSTVSCPNLSDLLVHEHSSKAATCSSWLAFADLCFVRCHHPSLPSLFPPPFPPFLPHSIIIILAQARTARQQWGMGRYIAAAIAGVHLCCHSDFRPKLQYPKQGYKVLPTHPSVMPTAISNTYAATSRCALELA